MDGKHSDALGPESVAAELEGTLLRHPDPFSYFMLVAFEASGLIRFAILLFAWPIIRMLGAVGMGDAGHRLMIFLALAGTRLAEIESVGRAVLPKFYMDDIDMEAWRVFSSYQRRLVVTKFPKVMVERFAKEHLRADEVIGGELHVNRFGLATGFLKDAKGAITDQVEAIFKNDQVHVGLGRQTSALSFLSHCKVSTYMQVGTETLVGSRSHQFKSELTF